MLFQGNYCGGKHNPKIHKSSAGQHYGRHPPPFNAAKFARNCEQAEAKGDIRWCNAEMLRRPERKPEEFVTVDIDMEPKSVEEQATEKDSDEMDTDITATDRTANTTKDRNVDFMACADETGAIGNHGLLPVEDFDKNFAVTKYRDNPAGERDETSAIEDHDMNPVRESHETSTTADHDMVPTEEPAKTSTSADHEKKPAKEPDETMDTADLRTNPVETPNNKIVGTKPFNLLGCPDSIVQQILRCVLVSDEQVKPYWNLGALEVAEKVSKKENFTTILVAFAGNKKLIDEATTILYGENVFNLQHAKVSLWWLTRIGSNVSKIKHLVISVEEGVMVDNFGTRVEKLWYSIFLLLKAQHKLQWLEVSFAKWTDRVYSADGLSPRKDIEIWEPRHGVVRTLLGFRELDRAIITPGATVNRYSTDLLQDALIMSSGQTNDNVIDMEQFIHEPKRAKYSF